MIEQTLPASDETVWMEDSATLTLRDILERMKPRINGARADGKTLAVAYVNEQGRPVVTLRSR